MSAPTLPEVKVWDGTNIQAVKAASTAAGATDPAAVVSLSPNSPLPAGSNALGSVTANQGTAAALGSAWPAKITDGTNTLPTMDAIARSGSVQVNDGTNVIGTSAHPVRVDPTGTTAQPVTQTGAGTSAVTQVASSATSVTLLSANSSRLQATIYNDSTQVLYVKFGTTASTVSYTVQLTSQAYYEVPARYTGRIDGIWASANGNAYVTELTA